MSAPKKHDEDYVHDSLEEAVSAGQGVCYHYIRILEDVFDALGIKNEAIVGNTHSFGTDHVWLRAWDDDSGCWRYLDPANPTSPGDCGTIIIDTYFEDYTAATIK